MSLTVERYQLAQLPADIETFTLSLIDHYYADRAVWESSLKLNDTLYVAREGTQLLGAAMVKWEPKEIQVLEAAIRLVYLGLTLAAPAARGKGVAPTLMRQLWEEVNAAKPLGRRGLYFRTATPMAYSAALKVMPNLQPTPAGNCEPTALAVLQALAQAQPGAPTETPFVVRGAAGYRYSEAEGSAVQAARKENTSPSVELFRRYDIRAEAGDRLLCVALFS